MEILKKIIMQIPLVLSNSIIGDLMSQKYKLERNFIEEKFTIETPKILNKEYQKELDNVINNEIDEVIINFIKTIKQNQPKENLYLLSNNISTFRKNEESIIRYIKNIILLTLTGYGKAGGYCQKKNVIVTINTSKYPKKVQKYIDQEQMKNILNHELLHLSSSARYEKTNMFSKMNSGFFQYSIGQIEIGRGINEGYTELLNERYFGEKGYTVAYKYEMLITKIIELIIGKEKMENFYFNANLNGLIQELSKYSDIESVKEFILDVDLINKSLSNIYIKDKDLLETNQIITNFLANLAITKTTLELKKQQIPEQEGSKIIIEILEILKKLTDALNGRLNKKIENSYIESKYQR